MRISKKDIDSHITLETLVKLCDSFAPYVLQDRYNDRHIMYQ